MSKSKHPVITDVFKKEAVRLIATSGRTTSQIAADLGVRLSKLTRWKRHFHNDMNVLLMAELQPIISIKFLSIP